MPTYEYRCSKCGAINTRMAMYATTRCGFCPGRAKRIYSSPAIHFKGSGFYTTDYRKKKHHGAKEDKPPEEVKKDADKKAEPKT